MGDASLGLVAAVVVAIDEAIWAEGLTVTGHVADVAVWATFVQAIVGIALPFIRVAMMTRFVGERRWASCRPTVSTPLCSRVLRVGG